ncbi:MAG: hypothetical protein IJT36_07935 [Alphaproteobacteria bacterium]|nr:hypothetical protein [Alphaproteobacteria bacterium]
MEIIYKNESYISLDEVLTKLKIKEYKLYEKISNKEISAPFKPESRAFWKKSEIEAYIEASKKEQ